MCDESRARRLRTAPVEPLDSDAAWLRRIARGNDASRRGPRRGPVAQAQGGGRRGSSCGNVPSGAAVDPAGADGHSECRRHRTLGGPSARGLHWELEVAKRGSERKTWGRPARASPALGCRQRGRDAERLLEGPARCPDSWIALTASRRRASRAMRAHSADPGEGRHGGSGRVGTRPQVRVQDVSSPALTRRQSTADRSRTSGPERSRWRGSAWHSLPRVALRGASRRTGKAAGAGVSRAAAAELVKAPVWLRA